MLRVGKVLVLAAVLVIALGMVVGGMLGSQTVQGARVANALVSVTLLLGVPAMLVGGGLWFAGRSGRKAT